MTIATASAGVKLATFGDIREVLVTNTGVAPETFSGQDGTALVDLGIDSLAVLELQAVVAQRHGGVEIPETALQMSVEEIVAFINDHVR
jgi:acyl carrier protein